MLVMKQERLGMYCNKVIEDIVGSTGKSYTADATTIIISVNHRSERDVIKHFKGLQIDRRVV